EICEIPPALDYTAQSAVSQDDRHGHARPPLGAIRRHRLSSRQGCIYRLGEGRDAGPHRGSRCNHLSRRGGHMTKFTRLMFKNLLRSKRRTVLTVLSIAVSLFIFAVLVSLPTFANQMLADTTSSVRIISRTKMGLSYPLPVA